MDIIIKGRDGKRKAVLGKGKPLADRPKSYIEVEIVSHSIGNLYNPSTAVLLRNRSGNLFLEIYRDGCFYPYYCPIFMGDFIYN